MTQVTINGKTALVSGANRGIGRATTIELLERGAAKVYAGARYPQTLEDLQAKYGERLVPVALDLKNDESIKTAALLAKDVDILINNAGVLLGSAVLSEGAVEELSDNLEVNVYGLLKLSHAFVNQLSKETPTAIVNVSSLAGLANMPVIGTYSVSKAAVHSITQGLRAELAAKNVLVSGVYPGPIDTEMVRGMEMDKDTPENVAQAIADGIENGIEDIFPDQMSAQAGQFFLQNPKGVEGEFGKFLPA